MPETETPVLTAGIDVGSSAVKVAVVQDPADGDAQLLASGTERIRRRDPIAVCEDLFEQKLSEVGVKRDDFSYVATTGEGELVPFRTGHFYGMTTHARGALHLVPEARAVMDIGALHARAIRIDARGKVLGHRMTSQCASGTGQFLENIARYLGVPIEDVGRISRAATSAEEVSSVCAVLSETDVINMVSRGLSTGEILRGIHLSIAGRLVRLLRAAGAEGVVALTGGLAHDDGLVAVLAELMSGEQGKNKKPLPPMTVVTHPLSALAGAIGAGILGAYRFEQLERQGRTIGAAAAHAG
jgi:benzoyl-CoA reductase subunit D